MSGDFNGKIYKVKNKLNGKIYIGQTIKTIKSRLQGQMATKHGIFHEALDKYGIDAFEFTIIDLASTRKELNEKEKFWIAFFNCQYPNGYNIRKGGGVATEIKISPTDRKERSKRATNMLNIMWQEADYKQRQTERNTGDNNVAKRTAVKEKISRKLKGRDTPWRTGKALSDEHKRKIAEANRGKHSNPNPAVVESNKKRAGEKRKRVTA